jgi:trehalose synthase
LQIEDGVTGYLVESVEEASSAALAIMRDQAKARHMGEIGREVVREKFLTTSLLRNYLRLFNDLMEQEASESQARMAKPVAW